MDRNAEVLFEYLRQLLYDPANAVLDTDALDADFRQLGKGLEFFGQSVEQVRELAMALAKGNLHTELPSRENELAAPLKNLHASLRHMTWQTQQVAKGDYKQRIDFMGDFAEAFNTMTQQLEQRQAALLDEIESGRQKALALEQSNTLFEVVTAQISHWIVVMDCDTREVLFMNQLAEKRLSRDDVFSNALLAWLRSREAAEVSEGEAPRETELQLEDDEELRVLSVAGYPLYWRGKAAVAYVIADVSKERRHLRQLESEAWRDNLTGVYSRAYGMRLLREWETDKKRFVICFVDIDNLKYVNDTLGHSEGDRYIMSVAKALGGFAPGAVLCRLGGDEFMVLAEGCGQQQAEAQMEALRDQLGAGSGPDYRRSLSYGVVQAEPDDPTPSGELLALADERMYQYKREHKQRPVGA